MLSYYLRNWLSLNLRVQQAEKQRATKIIEEVVKDIRADTIMFLQCRTARRTLRLSGVDTVESGSVLDPSPTSGQPASSDIAVFSDSVSPSSMLVESPEPGESRTKPRVSGGRADEDLIPLTAEFEIRYMSMRHWTENVLLNDAC